MVVGSDSFVSVIAAHPCWSSHTLAWELVSRQAEEQAQELMTKKDPESSIFVYQDRILKSIYISSVFFFYCLFQ